MKIKINGKEADTSSTTLLQLSKELSLSDHGVAIAIDNRMIPRTSWGETPLQEGISVVIIQAACGG